MKKFLFTIISFFILVSMTSCVASVYAQDDEMYSYEEPIVRTDVDIDIEIAITNGTPFIIDGFVQYYLYNNLYYYPYYYNNYFYYRVYTRPLIHYPRYWRPVPRGYWFRGDRFYRPNRYDRNQFDNVRRHDSHHPHIDRSRPNVHHNDNFRPRPESHQNRNFSMRSSSTRSVMQRRSPVMNNRTSRGGGRFGGRR